MVATEAAQDWIYDTLRLDPTIMAQVLDRVYNDYFPQKPRLPAIAIAQQEPGQSESAINGSNTVFFLKFAVFGVNKNTNPSAVAAQIRTLLHAQHDIMHEGHTIVSCVEVSPIDEPPDKFNGSTYKWLGGLYELLVV